ncbi:MAG: NUDIX domain-containing protein [Terriglobales bacterium]
MASARSSQFALPLQVAAVCYRKENSHAEFLLVNTNGGNKWTFPKGAPDTRLSHSQAAEREAREEAGATGVIEPRHFHVYIHSKGVFWQPGGVQEYVVKAFLMEVQQARDHHEDGRNPTWFTAKEARTILAKGREVKYARELQAVIDRAVEQIGHPRAALIRRPRRCDVDRLQTGSALRKS